MDAPDHDSGGTNAAGALAGRRIAVTRAERQLGEARRLFEAAGAEVLDLPALVIGPPMNGAHWMMPWLIGTASTG